MLDANTPDRYRSTGEPHPPVIVQMPDLTGDPPVRKLKGIADRADDRASTWTAAALALATFKPRIAAP